MPGKFKIGVNLEARWKLWKLGHFQNAGTKKRELVYTFHLFTVSSHILSWSSLTFYFFHPSKENNATFRALLTPTFLPYFIFQKVITSRVYKFSGCERNLLKKTILPVCHTTKFTANQLYIFSLSFSLSLSLFLFFGFRWNAITFRNNWMCHCTRKQCCLLFNLKVVQDKLEGSHLSKQT